MDVFNCVDLNIQKVNTNSSPLEDDPLTDDDDNGKNDTRASVGVVWNPRGRHRTPTVPLAAMSRPIWRLEESGRRGSRFGRRDRCVGTETVADGTRGVRAATIRRDGRKEKEKRNARVRVQTSDGGEFGRDARATVRGTIAPFGTENTRRVDRSERERYRRFFRGV